jgi:Mn-containing catalase
MKTAMQELIEYLEVRDRKFTYTYKKAIELLEKEKEQSIEFAMFMYEAVSQKNGVPNNLIQSSKRVFESQFDKRFNQNK